MPCILKLRVIRARDLPVMDKASDLTDAYVEVRFADYEVQRTQICRKSLNPVWNADFRIEVSNDADLQNEPVELRVLDYDTISANDIVGNVLIDINPLLAWEASSLIEDKSTSVLNSSANSTNERQISGWFPLYDTLCGIRGEVNVQIKLQFFGDVNPFKDSSAGVSLFTCPTIPDGYRVQQLFGLVEVLLNENDPEFSWADTFRAPRTSNESRQRVLYGLSGQLRRLIGRQVLEMQGNAIIGYKQSFDSESEGGIITGRAIGTCVRLVPIDHSMQPAETVDDLATTMQQTSLNITATTVTTNTVIASPTAGTNNIEDGQSSNPALNNSSQSQHSIPSSPRLEQRQVSIFSNTETSDAQNPSQIAMSTLKPYYQTPVDPVLLTIHSLPAYTITQMGGIVSAKSVKLYQSNNASVREDWWWELREEVQTHAKQLGCRWVMGYSESAAFKDELCVLSAVGTAVNIDVKALTLSSTYLPAQINRPDGNPNKEEVLLEESQVEISTIAASASPAALPNCRTCHVPYSRKHPLPFPMALTKCLQCGRKSVPELLFSTIDPPKEVDILGPMRLVEAHVSRTKKRKEGESNAAIVSDSLPFIEYDLHRQLMLKMRVLGVNALFGLKFQLSLDDGWMVAIASGTACYLAALPPPQPLRIRRAPEVPISADGTLVETTANPNSTSKENIAAVKEQEDILRNLIDAVGEQNRKELEDARKAYRCRSEISLTNSAPSTDTLPKLSGPATQALGSGSLISKINEETSSEEESGDELNNPQKIARRTTLGGVNGNDSSISKFNNSQQQAPLQRTSVVVQIDDDADEDLMTVLLDPCRYPNTFAIHNLNDNSRWLSSMQQQLKSGKYKICTQMQTVLKEAQLSTNENRPNAHLASFFHDLYDSVKWSCEFYDYSLFHGISVGVDMPEDGLLHLRVNGMVTGLIPDPNHIKHSRSNLGTQALTDEQEKGGYGETQIPNTAVPLSPTNAKDHDNLEDIPEEDVNSNAESNDNNSLNESQTTIHELLLNTSASHLFVDISPLSFIPGKKITSYLGRLSLHFVKEDLNLHHVYGNHYTDATYQQTDDAVDNDLGRFIHTFMVEIQAIVRAHTLAMGGNAVVGFRIEHAEFMETVKNQAYGMVSVGADVVLSADIDDEEEPGGDTSDIPEQSAETFCNAGWDELFKSARWTRGR